jgi:hypothetical protein
LTDKIETTVGRIPIATMHRAKRSEFRAVAVMACDGEAIRQPRSRSRRRYSWRSVPRTRADVVERALAQPTDLQLATLERFADARLAAQDAQEQGGRQLPEPPTPRRQHRALKVHPRPRDDC